MIESMKFTPYHWVLPIRLHLPTEDFTPFSRGKPPKKQTPMIKFIGSAILMAMTTLAHAQQEIKVEDAAKHEGDSVKVCTRIFGAKYFEGSNRAPTLLNAGAKYPEAPLTLVIFGESRPAFKNKPEEFYPDKNICVTGKILMYKGKPEIIITDEKQIVVMD
jgi:DNA/RNA endonuclease YhcR with UshA esterase domain